MPHSYSNLLVHVIFSTKDRLPSIVPEIRTDLHAYIGGIVRELKGSAKIVNGTADHAHILLRLPAGLSVADCLRVVKTNSSRWVHERWPQHKRFAWQTGYGAFAVSQSNLDSVKRYIERQEEHHRKMTFQEEFLMFLRKNGIEFDERCIWK